MGAADYLRTYNAQELERFAQQQLQELKRLGHFAIPVDIEAIVEKLNIEIDVQRGLREIHQIWGMVAVDLDTEGLVILVDDALLDSKYQSILYRMTIAEEFAHSLLHEKVIKEIKTVEDFKALQDHQDWHTHDRNAKRLAAALLMPSQNVLDDSRELYGQMISVVGHNNPEAIKKQIASYLASRYEVSVRAMKFRLNEWPIKVMDKIDSAMNAGLDFLD